MLDHVEHVAREIETHDCEPIEDRSCKDSVATCRGKRPATNYRLTRFGKSLWDACAAATRELSTRPEKFEFNPYIAELLRATYSRGEVFRTLHHRPDGLLQDEVDALRNITTEVRKACRSDAFRQQVKRFESASRSNLRSACCLLIGLFARYSRLLIVRVDLYYDPDTVDQDTTDRADEACKRFLRALSENRIVPDVVGWLIRREKGFLRGIHYHLLVAMNGNKRKDGYGYAKRIGEKWQNTYTGAGRVGTSYNCFARRDSYEHDGLGLVHISDEEKVVGLLEAARYVTKAYFKVRPEDDSRNNFHRSRVGRSWIKRGAPRMPGHDMRVIMRILGAA